MSSSPYHISNLLEKMSSSDKDFRFMATNDLMSELQKDSIKLDDESEKKVLKMLLKLLEDKNGEVQNLAVKCLGPLVAKIKEYQIETIVETLCSNMLSKKEQLRDISSIGIKTVINELPSLNSSMVANICKKITSRLTTAISNAASTQDDVSVQMEALDILGDLLHRRGTILSSFHNQVLDSLLPLLKSPRMAVRKRTITAISNLVVTCNSTVFGLLISHIVSQLQAADGSINNDKFCQTYVQCTGAVTRQAGHKIGQYLDQLMPLISSFCKQQQENDELKEHCIQSFELFIRKCPLEVTSYIDGIIALCLEYITYDPNYNYDSDECDEVMEEDEEDDDDIDDYSDDDDISWKVRRACAKCIEAIASTRQELLCCLYTTISQPLIARFKEREENVKADIFNAYISLVKYTKYVATPSGKESTEDANMSMETEDTPLSLLLGQVPSLVKAIFVHLKQKSIKTRECCFSLLTQLVVALPGCLADHLANLVPGIQHSLSSDRHNTSNMKINTLHFLHILLKHHDHKVIKPYVHILVPAVVTTSQDSFYKITSDALHVMQDLIKVVCNGESDANTDKHVLNLYNATVTRLRASDIDQEVKERAIMCMGQIISCAGKRLSAQVPGTLEIFLDRLRNEITRLTTVRALHMIASAQTSNIGMLTKVPLDSILSQAMPVLANFLRKNQRSLRISSLQCLHSIFTHYGSDITVEMIRSVEREVPPLITENDLYISQLAIRLLTLMLNTPLNGAWPSVHDERPNLKEDIMPNTYAIVQSSLLQGYALNAVLEFFRTLVTCDSLCRRDSPIVDELTFRYILRMLIEPIYKPSKQAPKQTRTSLSPSASSQATPLTKQACHSTAKCIASLTKAQPQECGKIVRQFMMDVCDQKSNDSIRMFALLSIGEIGVMIDLSSFTELEKIIMKCFNASSEEVKSAASFSLGRVSVGNLRNFLPPILMELRKQPKSQYLLLNALKETIIHSPNDVLDNYIADIWELLFDYSECSEEGTRNIVAECLGKMVIHHPEVLLPDLRENLRSPKALVRATMVTAFKFTITDQPLPVDPMLKDCIGEFLALLLDSEINVCRVALTMFNSAAHNKPSLIRDLLPEVLPHLYNETKIRKELIREVLMGPFRHTVDDGLDVRKAAFECMYTLLDTCVAQLDIFQFITYMESGLKDSYDIKMLTFLMLVRLSNICPNVVLQHLDRLIEPIRATCTVKVKADSVKQEFEKQDELKRSALRAIHALLNIPEADKSPAMSEFLAQVSSSTELTQMFESVQKDFAAASNPSASQTQFESMDTS